MLCDLQSVSTCDWMNAVAQSTLAGELTVIFTHQLLIAVDTEKGVRDKRMVSMPCDLVDELCAHYIPREKHFAVYVTVVLEGIIFSSTPQFGTFSSSMKSCFTFLIIMISTFLYTNECVSL
jgi:hypothetical protein